MLDTHTYDAVLIGNRLEWSGDAPDRLPADQPVQVQVTIIEQSILRAETETRGQQMAAALERIAAKGGLTGIADPSAWQREVRQDRRLPGRDE